MFISRSASAANCATEGFYQKQLASCKSMLSPQASGIWQKSAVTEVYSLPKNLIDSPTQLVYRDFSPNVNILFVRGEHGDRRLPTVDVDQVGGSPRSPASSRSFAVNAAGYRDIASIDSVPPFLPYEEASPHPMSGMRSTALLELGFAFGSPWCLAFQPRGSGIRSFDGHTDTWKDSPTSVRQVLRDTSRDIRRLFKNDSSNAVGCLD